MLTPELTNYINQAKAAGMTDQQIRDELIKTGWQPADVEEAFSGAFAPTTYLAVSKKIPLLKIGIIAVSAILLIAGSASAFWYADKQFDWGIISPKTWQSNRIKS